MPLLFIILFGIGEFAVLLYDKAMITNASRGPVQVV
jgi:Flp pilus assembly protein TadG